MREPAGGSSNQCLRRNASKKVVDRLGAALLRFPSRSGRRMSREAETSDLISTADDRATTPKRVKSIRSGARREAQRSLPAAWLHRPAFHREKRSSSGRLLAIRSLRTREQR